MRVVIVGGGPAGLYLAELLRRERAHDVTVLERNPPHASYGFGVVFSDSTLSSVEEQDPETARLLTAHGPSWEHIEVRLRGGVVRCGGHGFTAIARATLLKALHQRAREAGADLRFGVGVARPDDLPDHDLLVAADGVNSTVRGWHVAAFAPEVVTGDARFIWLGTTLPLTSLTFVFAESEHGAFGVHGYPYELGTSTFLVETDPETWRAAGFDRYDAGEHAPGESDEATIAYLRDLYADDLRGHDLLGSNSRWLRFATVRCARWSHERTVLVGDAAHTAHFSVGSGTRMAMEDALALSRALDEHGDVGDALAAYEAVRRPAVERIQQAAEPSLRWWERFRTGLDWDLERFAFHFLTRTPAVTRDRLAARDRGFVEAVDAWWAAGAGAPVGVGGPLAAPLDLGGPTVPNRVAVRARPPLAAAAGAGLVLVDPRTEVAAGPSPSGAVAIPEVRGGPDAVAAARGRWPRAVPVAAVLEVVADGGVVDEDASVARAGELVAAGATVVSVEVPPGVPPTAAGRDRWRQLLVSERVRAELGAVTVLVDAAPDADRAATLVESGRADLVCGGVVPPRRDAQA